MIWIVAVRLVFVAAQNASRLSRLGRHHVRVDLYDTTPLRAFSRIGNLGVLLIMGALALTPLQALDAEFRLMNYLWAFSLGVPAGIALLLAPMWGIRQRLREEKARALEEVRLAIDAAELGLGAGDLTYLNALLERRLYLLGIPEWPMDLRSVSKVGFYFVLPPLAWIAAALVENAVESVLGG